MELSKIVSNTRWLEGDIHSVLSLTPRSLDNYLFVALLTGDWEYVVRVCTELDLRYDKSPFIKVARALAFFHMSDMRSAIADLQAVKGLEELKKETGVAREFYSSNYVHLAKLLNENYKDFLVSLNAITKLSKSVQSVPVIGDSHVLAQNLIQLNDNTFTHSHYVPGLKLWQLADPQSNLIQSGFKLALNKWSRSRIVFISVGEIDFRIMPERKIPYAWHAHPYGVNLSEKVVKEACKVTSAAIKSVCELAHPGQVFFFQSIQPPNPLLVRVQELSPADTEKEFDLIQSTNREIESTAKSFGHLFIDRSSLLTRDFMCRPECFVDNKHLGYSIHKEILTKSFMSLIRSTNHRQ